MVIPLILLYRSLVSLPRAIGSLELVKARLRDIALWSYHSYDGRKVKSGLSEAECIALKELSMNKDIVIQKSDKGNSVAILDKKDYIQKMNSILSDRTKFVPSQFTPHGKVYNYIINLEGKIRKFLGTLVNKQTISHEIYRKLAPTGSVPGRLYGLCKVHKDGFPLRPILSAIGTPTYAIAKFLVPILSDTTKNQWAVKDSFSFAKEIACIPSTGLTMGSLDVKSLFTNVPLDEAIQITVDGLYSDPDDIVSGFEKQNLETLLNMAAKDIVFTFNGKYFTQIDGCAMGSPLGPTLANAFMAHHEQHWLRDCPPEYKPELYRRYVDDVFVLFRSPDHLPLFQDYLNTKHPNIEFTSEKETAKKFSFLDVEIDASSGQFVTSIYRKTTFSGVYSHFDSFIPRTFKLGLVLSLLFRIYSICSSWSLFHNEIAKLKCILSKNGYPRAFVDLCVDRFLNSVCTPKTTVAERPENTVTIVLPYLGKLSNDVRTRILRLCKSVYPDVKCRIVFKTLYRISNSFPFKDRHPLALNSGVIYNFTCTCCNTSYIGKSIRHLHTRVCEHKRVSDRTGKPCNSDSEPSAIFMHSRTCCNGDVLCPVSLDDFTVIGRAESDFLLRIKESLFINKFKPGINRQGAVHSLPLSLF